jgi:hypothetical protein
MDFMRSESGQTALGIEVAKFQANVGRAGIVREDEASGALIHGPSKLY